MSAFRETSAVLACLLMGSAMLSADARAQEAPPQVTDTHVSGDWVVRCIRAQTATVCELVQIAIDRARNVKIASIEISYVPQSDTYRGRFGVPLGVSFDHGLGIDIGGFHAENLKYRVCERDGCYVTGVLPPALIAAMKDATTDKGSMSVQMIDGHNFQIPIVLNGFPDGVDLLKKWTAEKAGGTAKPAK